MPPFTSYDMRSRRKESPIEDLSSVDANSYANPYDALLRPEVYMLTNAEFGPHHFIGTKFLPY